MDRGLNRGSTGRYLAAKDLVDRDSNSDPAEKATVDRDPVDRAPANRAPANRVPVNRDIVEKVSKDKSVRYGDLTNPYMRESYVGRSQR